METFFAALMGVGGVTASTMCVLEWIMSKPSEPSETREIIAYIFFAIWVVGVIGTIIVMNVK